MYVLLLKLTIAAGLLFLLAVDAPGGKTGKYQVLWHDVHGGHFVLEFFPRDKHEDVSKPEFAAAIKSLERGQAYVLTNVDWVASLKSK